MVVWRKIDAINRVKEVALGVTTFTVMKRLIRRQFIVRPLHAGSNPATATKNSRVRRSTEITWM
jgi:hypothetical protein